MARPKGAKNKRNLEVEEIALRFDMNPFEVLMMIAAGDWKGLGFEEKTHTTFTPQGIEIEEQNISVGERGKAAAACCKYLYSAKQSVEVSTGQSGFKVIIEDYSKK